MNHMFSKTSGRYVGMSINNVDNRTNGSTEVSPAPELVNPVWNGEAWEEGAPPEVTRISRRQGKQQLVIAGYDEQVEATIDAIEDPVQRKLTRIWYNDEDYWDIDSPQLLGLASIMRIPEQEIVELFKSASTL